MTGDIVTIGQEGEITIRDRDKDVIKSGGEWISSLELELKIDNVPGVISSAVIGRPHPTWGERPVAVLVREKGSQVEPSAIREALSSLEKWQRPDDFIWVDALPTTGTGKIDKKAIRKMLDDQSYVLPSLRAKS